MNAVYDSLKKINNKKDVILVKDFDSKACQLGWQRKNETFSWMHDLSKEISTFRNFSKTGMSIHSSFKDALYRVKRAIRALESAIQDEFVNPKQIAVLGEVKDELEAYLLILEFGKINEEAM
ncbi:MAG: hypothetical protein K0R18_132 [Bacillales bacterium]|jgi:hypothetical protein|nr:hypothetical protein [Bacillales bacterium]